MTTKKKKRADSTNVLAAVTPTALATAPFDDDFCGRSGGAGRVGGGGGEVDFV